MTKENKLFTPPDLTQEKFVNAPNVKTEKVSKEGVAPKGFYLTSHMPTYYKLDGKWILPKRSSLCCVAVLVDGDIVIKEIRDLKIGDEVVMTKKDDGSTGILKYAEGFSKQAYVPYGTAVETASTSAYDELFELMRHEKENGGFITWVLGPAVVFDHDTRIALSRLAEAGYVQALLGGNAMATHDLEGGYIGTALGQDIYTQVSMPMGHYNHLDTLNAIRRVGSTQEFIDQGHVKNGFIKTLKKLDVPITLAGSVRDDGPLPEVTGDVDVSLSHVREQTDQSTLIICLATMLHSVSTAEMASSYRVDEEGNVIPVFIYSVDVTENVVNKVSAARDHIAVKPMVTNVQDFVVNMERALVPDQAYAKDSKAVEEPQYVESGIEKEESASKAVER